MSSDRNTELGNQCRYCRGMWLCGAKNGLHCRYNAGIRSSCGYKNGDYCTSAIAMADAYALLKQRLEYVVESTRFETYEKSIMSLKYSIPYIDWLLKKGRTYISQIRDHKHMENQK